MKNFKTFFAFLLILIAASFTYSQKTPSDAEMQKAEKAFQTGNTNMEQGKYAEALKNYQEVLAVEPDETSSLYNGGIAAFKIKDFKTAETLWTRLKTVDSSDWQVRAKLIQTYQALGKITDRDRERKDLFDLWKSGLNAELNKQFQYCREQFEVGGKKVMAFEHFELKGDRALRYVFSILNKTENDEEFRISLGSYDMTNAIWHETTKPTPKKEDRLFHLDGYFNGGHATYGMYFPEPTYDDIREKVVQILENKAKAISSSTVVQQPKTKQ